ncbi:MAG: hypothetical protein F6K54_15035 [Okeania sp. SIO3B5]|nr:hypothetical protein [Okeania sp. SIO3B5]NEO54283.1 hypothetical protein [Okeania sp. SIO3B5]
MTWLANLTNPGRWHGSPSQGLKSLANSLSHLKMTLEEYAIFLYCG